MSVSPHPLVVGVIEQANVQINAWKSQVAQERAAEQHGFSSVTPIELVDRDNTPLTMQGISLGQPRNGGSPKRQWPSGGDFSLGHRVMRML